MNERDNEIYFLQGLLYKFGVPVYAVGGLVFVLSIVTFAVRKIRQRRAENRDNVGGEGGGGNEGPALSFPLLAEPGDFDVEINNEDLPPPNAPTHSSNSARTSNAPVNARNNAPASTSQTNTQANNASSSNLQANAARNNATTNTRTNAQTNERGGASNPQPSPVSAGPSNLEQVQNPTYDTVTHSFTVRGEPSTSTSLYAAGRQPPLPAKPSTSKDNGWSSCTLQVPNATPKAPPRSSKKRSPEKPPKRSVSVQNPPPTAEKSTQSPTHAETKSQTKVKEVTSPVLPAERRQTSPNVTPMPPLLPRTPPVLNSASPSLTTSTPTVQTLASPATPFRNLDETGSPKSSDWNDLYLTSLSRLENITTDDVNQSTDNEISMGNTSGRHEHSQDDKVKEESLAQNNNTVDSEISFGVSSRRHNHSQDDTVPEEEVSMAIVAVGNASNLDESAAATPQQSISLTNDSRSENLQSNASANNDSLNILALSPSLFNDFVGASNMDQSLQVSIEMSNLE